MKLVIDVDQAIGQLERNKKKHLAEYQLQMEAWKKAYEEYTVSLRKWSQEQPVDSEETKRPKEPIKPQYYAEAYDQLIRKLKVHVGPSIELSDGYGDKEYEKIFENKFDWSSSFANISGGYITSGHIDVASIRSIRED